MYNKLINKYFLLFSSLFLLAGCGLIGTLKNAVNDAKNALINSVLEAALESAKANGGTAILIDDFTIEVSAAITDSTSVGFGAGILFPANSIDAGGAKQVILSIQPLPGGSTAPRDVTYQAVGPLIDFTMKPADQKQSAEISLTKAATLTLPFKAAELITGDTVLAAYNNLTSGNPIFEILQNQRLVEGMDRVKGDTLHLSQYGPVVDRPLPPPAVKEGINRGSMFATVMSGSTEACRYSTSTSPKWLGVTVRPPEGSQNGNFEIFGSNGTNMLNLTMELSGDALEPKPVHLLDQIVDGMMNHYGIDCVDANSVYWNVFSVEQTKNYRGLEVVAVAITETTQAACSWANDAPQCNLHRGTVTVYWNIDAIDMHDANFSGSTQGYVDLPVDWYTPIP